MRTEGEELEVEAGKRESSVVPFLNHSFIKVSCASKSIIIFLISAQNYILSVLTGMASARQFQ